MLLTILCPLAVAGAAPEVDLAAGLWPLDLPVNALVDEQLDSQWFPEPTVRLTLVSRAPHRTVWTGGVQVDWLHHTWTFADAPWYTYDGGRLDLQLGARTTLGPVDRETGTRGWIDWGGGIALVARRWANGEGGEGWTGTGGPSLQLGLGVANGDGRRPWFVEGIGRLGLLTSYGIAECTGTGPCPAVARAPAGPGVALLGGVAFR